MISSFDFSAFIAKNIKTEEDWTMTCGGMVYSLHVAQPNFESVRNGVSWTILAKGVGYKNHSYEAHRRCAAVYSGAYPIRLKEITILDTHALFHFLFSLVAMLMSRKIRDVIRMTSTKTYLETQRLDKDTLPSCMGGTFTEEKFLEKCDANLKERFENSASYTLPA